VEQSAVRADCRADIPDDLQSLESVEWVEKIDEVSNLVRLAVPLLPSRFYALKPPLGRAVVAHQAGVEPS